MTTTTMTIAVLHQKGGVGKTTLTLNLAREAQERGQRALVVDSDPQRTTAEFRAMRADHASLLPLPVVELSTSTLHTEIPTLAHGYDKVFIDSSAGISQRSISAAKAADVILIPTSADAPELWSAVGIFRMVHEVIATSVIPKLVIVVYNRTAANARTLTAVRKVQDDIASQFAVNFLSTTLTRRTAWSACMGLGQSVLEGKGRSYDPKAIAELKGLYTELETNISDLNTERSKLRLQRCP